MGKYKQEVKAQVEEDFKEGGQRNWLQVLCNGGMAFELSLLYLLDIGSSDLPVDFRHQYRASWLGVAVLGALACCNGDTWASELGTVLAKDDPFLITTNQMLIILVGGLGGLLGSVLDSLIGASLQFSGKDEKTGKIVEVAREGVIPIAGKMVLDNHSVNLVSSILTALLLPKIALACGL